MGFGDGGVDSGATSISKGSSLAKSSLSKLRGWRGRRTFARRVEIRCACCGPSRAKWSSGIGMSGRSCRDRQKRVSLIDPFPEAPCPFPGIAPGCWCVGPASMPLRQARTSVKATLHCTHWYSPVGCITPFSLRATMGRYAVPPQRLQEFSGLSGFRFAHDFIVQAFRNV